MLRRRTVFVAVVLFALSSFAQEASRHFTFRYAFTVKEVTPGRRLRVWFPLAQSDPWQEVRVVSATGDLPLRRTIEPEYGNAMFYAEARHATRPEYRFEVVYNVVRHEHVAYAYGRFVGPRAEHAPQLARFLQPDRLVPLSGTPAQAAAAQVVAGKHDEIAEARAMYDYVLANMRYDKSGTGWGRGDVLYACDARHGNCTDFHSLFISMARSQGIPARFEIGFSIPGAEASGEIAAYHCWSEFYLQDRGWVPVDISEAWKAPAKRDYFFGAHDDDRVQFSIGRDITLHPRQHGGPLNYFIYPYVELDGAAYPNVANAFSFSEVPSATARLR